MNMRERKPGMYSRLGKVGAVAGLIMAMLSSGASAEGRKPNRAPLIDQNRNAANADEISLNNISLASHNAGDNAAPRTREGQANTPAYFASEATSRSAAACSSCGAAGCSGNKHAPSCKACGCAKKKKKANPLAKSHKGVFYANDFSYLNDPNNTYHGLGDVFKQLDVGHDGKLDVGGQFRLRYHREKGMNKGQPRFQNNADEFVLSRLRMYADYKWRDGFRFYVEGIFADTTGQSLPPRGIDRNQGDLLNALIDVAVTDRTTVRLGRQELIYGNERLVSPLDWANTRRTFEGIKGMYKSDDWSVDAFFTNLVVVQPFDFDEADYDQSFYGAYSVYSGFEHNTVDLYYLGYDNQTTQLSIHTLGGRLNGGRNDWLWEAEGATQFGDAAGVNIDQDAGFATVGLGRKFSRLAWKPELWAYYDYASGDALGTANFEGFNQLFPLSHKYFGFIDAVQRSNIEAPNFLLKAKPSKKTSLLLWYYIFQSNTSAPVPSLGGTPAQNAGKNLGQELDLIFKYQIAPRSDILFGYSHFWRGSKISETNDADFIYTQFTVNF